MPNLIRPQPARWPQRLVWLLCTALCAGPALAQQDRAAEKAARRQQQQLQQLQEQVSKAQAEKSKLEQDRGAVEQQLKASSQAAAKSSSALRAASERAKALEADKSTLEAKVAELEKALEQQRQAAEQLRTEKDRELATAAQGFKAMEAQSAAWQQRFGQQVRLTTECSDKNDRLFKVSAELLDRWRGKTALDALRQREPVLGWSDVQMFNQVQDYRDKAELERFVPRVERN